MTPDAGGLGRLAASVADGSSVDVRRRQRRRIVAPDLDETAPEGVPVGPRWGRLVLLERIGQGMSCDVHRAFDTDLYRHVALKLLHEDGFAGRAAHDRILQEARRLARVRHPHPAPRRQGPERPA